MNEDRKLVARVRQTLERIANASLATVSPDGRPWNSPLYVAFDARLTFYWSSHNDAIHSQNIAANPEVMFIVFDSTATDRTGHAVYVRGTARELVDETAIDAALHCLAKRKNERTKDSSEFIGPHPRRVYAAVPASIWTNVVKEQGGHYFDERVDLDVRVIAGSR
jgi:general stress protein 26